jgi:hypothetical protein
MPMYLPIHDLASQALSSLNFGEVFYYKQQMSKVIF